MRTRKGRTVILGDLRFPVAAESPHAAREMVGLIFDVWSIAELHSAQLCVSELTTNVFTHASGCEMRVMVSRRRDRVRVEVHDASVHEPQINTDMAVSESGNGLFLVDAVSADWGFRLTPAGKVVWFELATSWR
jgi:anti-sigma regulatory factor (Ser/Thr protein kinase)